LDVHNFVRLLELEPLGEGSGEPRRHVALDVVQHRDSDVKVARLAERSSEPPEFTEQVAKGRLIEDRC
jgi:hypothetical protein